MRAEAPVLDPDQIVQDHAHRKAPASPSASNHRQSLPDRGAKATVPSLRRKRLQTVMLHRRAHCGIGVQPRTRGQIRGRRMDTLLAIEGLSKRFGAIRAVDGIDFSVGRGEMLGFLGPNGAGKSTTMRMIAGYLPPDRGSVSVCGFDVARRPLEVKRRLGYLPEGAPTYGEMTPSAIMSFVADVRRFSAADKRRRIDAMIERLHLETVLHQPIETLSKGFKRRVGLALALLHEPDVLILDEPTDGLDPNQKHEVRTLLAELATDRVIIISTHILEEVEAICSRAIIIAKGRIVADAKPSELLARSAYHNAVGLRLPSAEAALAQATIAQLEGVVRIEEHQEQDSAELIAFAEPGAEILDQVRTAVRQGGIAVDEIYVDRGRLDEVFRDLTAA
jgi:ABC-2 type transport system ATP-binding protein